MTRELAVEKVFKNTKKPSSYIRLRGQWLYALGFQPGSRVKVIPLARGKVVLCTVAIRTPMADEDLSTDTTT